MTSIGVISIDGHFVNITPVVCVIHVSVQFGFTMPNDLAVVPSVLSSAYMLFRFRYVKGHVIHIYDEWEGT